MSARNFFDTTIFVYSFDSSEPAKRTRARELISGAPRDSSGVISSQVVQEFLNVASRKFESPLSFADPLEYLNNVLAPLCTVFPSVEMDQGALDVQERWQLPFYDSLIVTAALMSGCERLYSEDLQDGQKIRQLTIENPFRGS